MKDSKKQDGINNPASGAQETEEKIPVHGFQQIVDMLKVADPAFRDSLLARLAARDRRLALSLQRDLHL